MIEALPLLEEHQIIWTVSQIRFLWPHLQLLNGADSRNLVNLSRNKQINMKTMADPLWRCRNLVNDFFFSLRH